MICGPTVIYTSVHCSLILISCWRVFLLCLFLAMGADAFGVLRYRCAHAGGCACDDFVSTLDALDDEKRTDVLQTQRFLTCQRKSELVLLCSCGHPAWDHESTPSTCSTTSIDGEFEVRAHAAGEWAEVLRDEMLHLGPLLQQCLSLDTAYELLDSDRPELLRRLRGAGIEALRERQTVANTLGRARRLAMLEAARQQAAGPG